MPRINIVFIIIILTAAGAFAFWTGTVQDQLISQDDNFMGWYTRIAVDSDDNIHVVWNERIDNLPLQNEIHYSRSSDYGQNWSAMNQDIIISFNDSVDANTNSSIAIDSEDNIFVVWPEDVIDIREIHYSISRDGGNTWTGQSRDYYLSTLGGTDALNPDIAIDENDVIHVVWNQDNPATGIDEIFYSRSTNGGATWSAETIISYPDGDAASTPEIEVGADNEIYVVWKESDDVVTTNSVVNVSISTDGGLTWSGTTADIPLTQSFRMIYDPRIVVDSNGIAHCIWRGTQDQASPFHYEVYHSRSLNNGVTWSGMTGTTMISYYPAGDFSANVQNIGVDGFGNVVAVWDEDYLDDNNEIMVSASTDGGLTWSGQVQDEIISFPDNHPAYRPFIAATSDGQFHVTWNEVTTTSYYQIHYSRGDALMTPTGLSVTLTPASPPILIPANGGSFNFNIHIANTNASPMTFDIWTTATLPNGSEYGPIINMPNFTAPANFSGGRDRTQFVPANAPAGQYTYDAWIGSYPNVVWAEDHFSFLKVAVDDGAKAIEGWDVWGEDFTVTGNINDTSRPSDFALLSSYPNPFNPTAVISYTIREASPVTIDIFNITGAKISLLADKYHSAGTYEIEWNAENFPAGIYFARLTAGKDARTIRMVLVK